MRVAKAEYKPTAAEKEEMRFDGLRRILLDDSLPSCNADVRAAYGDYKKPGSMRRDGDLQEAQMGKIQEGAETHRREILETAHEVDLSHLGGSRGLEECVRAVCEKNGEQAWAGLRADCDATILRCEHCRTAGKQTIEFQRANRRFQPVSGQAAF